MSTLSPRIALYGWWMILILCLALAIPEALAQPTSDRPTIKIAVDSTQVELGQTVTVEVRIDMPAGREILDYVAPSSVGLELKKHESKVVRSRGAHNSQLSDGRWATVHRYTMVATRLGRLALGLASMRYGNDTIASPRLSILVVPTRTEAVTPTAASEMLSPAYSGPRANSDVMLYAFSDKDSAWVGEKLTLSWLLYTKTELLKYQPTPPSLSGLWSESLFDPTAFFDYTEATVDGVPYVVSLVSKRALYTTRPGALTIPPLSAEIATLRTPLGRTERVESNTVEVSIRPLPPEPDGFDESYVGQFDIEAELDRTHLVVGQPATLKLRVKGTGAMGRLRAPTLVLDGFSVTPISSSAMGDFATNRVFQYWLVAKREGSLRIPRIELISFNPRHEGYESSFTRELWVEVRRYSNQELLGLDERSHDSKLENEEVEVKERVNLRELLFWCGLAAAGSILLFALIYLKKRKAGD